MEVEGRRIILLDSRPADPATAVPVVETQTTAPPASNPISNTPPASPVSPDTVSEKAADADNELDDLPF